MKIKRLNKKGQVSIQINWIFVLIVGAIILIFFVSLIVKQKTVSDTKHSIKIREGLDAIFTSSQVATGTANEVILPDINVEFDCNTFFVGDFDTGISKSLQESRIIFVPDRLKGKKLLTWSLDWNLPYKISDFLYITSSEMKYIVAHDSSQGMKNLAEEVYDELPDKLNKELVDLTTSSLVNIANQNNYKVRYIFFTSDSPSCSSENPSHCIAPTMKNKKTEITALHILSRGDRSEITFYSYDRGEDNFIEIGSTTHIDFNSQNSIGKKYPSLYGAIFTDDIELYNCMLGKAFKRHSFITSIYIDRVTKMKEDASGEMKLLGCPFLYPQPESSLTSLLSSVSEPDCSPIFNPDCNPPDFYQLEQQNTDLQVNSCPLVY